MKQITSCHPTWASLLEGAVQEREAARAGLAIWMEHLGEQEAVACRKAALLEVEREAAADMQAKLAESERGKVTADEEQSRLKWIQKEKLAEEERKLAQGRARGSQGAVRMAAEEEISE